jgi:hypothetical protein
MVTLGAAGNMPTEAAHDSAALMARRQLAMLVSHRPVAEADAERGLSGRQEEAKSRP